MTCTQTKPPPPPPHYKRLRWAKKGHNSVNIWRMISKFELDLYFMMLYPSVNFECNWCIPSKLNDRKQKVWRRGRKPHLRQWSHDPYVSTTLQQGTQLNFKVVSDFENFPTVYMIKCLKTNYHNQIFDLHAYCYNFDWKGINMDTKNMCTHSNSWY